MSGPLLDALLAGFLLSNPVLVGYIPTSALAATGRPRHAWPYAAYGAIAILLFSWSGWLLHLVLLPIRAGWLELPLDIAILWGINRLMPATARRSEELAAQAPFFALNCAVLGAGLLVTERFPQAYAPALLFAIGLSVSFFCSVIIIAHVRERIETVRFSPLLAGWPSFLLLCGFCWITFQGLALLAR
jgi:Na+-translocating ferredoxin:NAD+ oxidoreductase RnfA subunit